MKVMYFSILLLINNLLPVYETLELNYYLLENEKIYKRKKRINIASGFLPSITYNLASPNFKAVTQNSTITFTFNFVTLFNNLNASNVEFGNSQRAIIKSYFNTIKYNNQLSKLITKGLKTKDKKILSPDEKINRLLEKKDIQEAFYIFISEYTLLNSYINHNVPILDFNDPDLQKWITNR